MRGDTSDPTEPDARGAQRWIEWGLHAAVVLVVAFVFQVVLRNPGGILYSSASDILAKHHPYRHLLSASLRERGELPLWNPIEFCGTPLIGDPQGGILYPLNWLHALLPPDESGAMFGWVTLLHLIAGGFGVLWWLRSRGLSPAARLVGALAFCLCGKWFQHVVVPGHVIFLPLVWAPWQLGLIDRLWREPSMRAAAELGLVTAVAIAGYHSQLFFYGHLLLAGYALCTARTLRPQRPLHSAGAFGMAAAIALAGAAAHLLPILELLEADAFIRAAGIPYQKAALHSLALADYRAFLIPSAAASGWETNCYVGVAALSLALFGAARRAERAIAIYFLVAIGFALWFALGDNASLHRFLHEGVPGFGLFRIPSRILLTLGIPIAYLAASGFEALGEEEPSLPIRVAAGALAAAGLVLFASERSGEAAWAAVGMALPGLCALRPPRRFATALSAAALVLFAADQIRYAKPLVEVRSVEDAYGRNPVVQRVHAPLGRQRTVALNHTRKGRFSSLPITYAAQAEIEILHGFSPLLPRGCYQMLWSGVAQEPLNWRFATDMGTFPIVERRFLDLLNVRWVVTNRALELQGLTLRERLDDIEVYHYTRSTTGLTLLEETYVYENQHVMPRAAIVRAAERVASMQEAIERIPAIDPRKTVLLDGQGALAAYAGSFEPVQVTHRYDELQMTLDAGDGGYLLLSEMWFPGWRAWDGRREIEILRANGAFQAVHLSPGRHHLRFAYQPAAYELGTKLSAMGFGTGALLLLYGGARRRNSPAGAARIYSDNGQALEPRSR